MSSLQNSTKLRKESKLVFIKLFHKIENRETLPAIFYKAYIILIIKLG